MKLAAKISPVPFAFSCLLLATPAAYAQSFVRNTADIPGGSIANASTSENIDFGDVDGDGDWDIAIANGGDTGNQQNRLWLNLGPGAQLGKFQDATSIRFPLVSDASRDIEFADLDGDSDLDLYVANHSSIVSQPCRWWINTGTGSYVDETSTRWVGLGAPGSSVAPSLVLAGGGFIDWSGDGDFADLDNDGDLDLFHSSYGGVYGGGVPSRIFLNDGGGFFSEFNPSGFQLPNQNIPNGSPGIWCEGTQQNNTFNSSGMFCDVASNGPDIDLGDIDGDFDIDVLHGNRSGSPRMFTNRLDDNGGVLGFRDSTSAAFESDYAGGQGHYEQEMGDMDGDGDLDILGVNWSGTGFGFSDRVLTNSGSGFYAIAGDLAGSASDDEEGDLLDYDNDGDLDLFIANFSGDDRLYRNTGGSSLSFANVTAAQLPSDNSTSRDGEACDVDGDGDYDIFTANSFLGANTYFQNVTQIPDTSGPYIPHIEQAPNRMPGSAPTVIRAHVYDNAPYYITWYNDTILTYNVDGGMPQAVQMVSSGGQVFRGEIPGNLTGNINYAVFSKDEYGNSGLSSILGYVSNASGSPGTALCFGDGTGSPCPCGNTGQAGAGCLNGSSSSSTLTLAGTNSVTSGNLILLADGMVPGKPCVFFQGTLSLNNGMGIAFGDGLRCAGGGLVRLQILITNGTGEATSSVNIAQAGGVNAGQNRTYQTLYRDPQGSPCGGGFNTSGAIELTWVP